MLKLKSYVKKVKKSNEFKIFKAFLIALLLIVSFNTSAEMLSAQDSLVNVLGVLILLVTLSFTINFIWKGIKYLNGI